MKEIVYMNNYFQPCILKSINKFLHFSIFSNYDAMQIKACVGGYIPKLSNEKYKTEIIVKYTKPDNNKLFPQTVFLPLFACFSAFWRTCYRNRKNNSTTPCSKFFVWLQFL